MDRNASEPGSASPEQLSDSARRGLIDFLHRNRDRAIAEWERIIGAMPVAAMLDREELRDHMPMLLDRVRAFVEKSPSRSRVPSIGELPEEHAVLRMREGFDLEQVAWEYSTLRSTLLRLNEEAEQKLEPGAIVLLNDAIDHAVVRAVTKFHRARVRIFEALDRIAEEGLLAEPTSLDELLHRLIDIIMTAVDEVDTAVLFLRERDCLVVRAAAGLEHPIVGEFSLAMGEGFAGAVAASRRPIMTHSAQTDPRVKNPVLRMEGVKALYGVPLMYGNEVIGVAKMGSRTVSDFKADDRLLLRSAADRAAAFIAQRRHVDEREMALRVLGHDLRSPLNTIVLGAGSLQKSAGLEPAAARTLARVLSAANRMAGILSDFTDYTQTRAAGTLSLNREKLDMRELVEQATHEVQRDSKLVVDCVGDLTGEWDKGRILRVLVNLLNNAQAYGAPSSPLTVRAEADGRSVIVSVHNEGAPIAPELLPHVFEPFRRGASGSGSGLGLFIVQEIVRAHGGTIGVDSEAGRGTTFVMRLPRDADAH